jgi:hypothetical protein
MKFGYAILGISPLSNSVTLHLSGRVRNMRLRKMRLEFVHVKSQLREQETYMGESRNKTEARDFN